MPGREIILAVTSGWFISGNLFMWYQKMTVSCMFVFGDEGIFELTAEVLSRISRINPLTWDVM